MGEIIVKNAVERKSGYLYYIDGEGNLCEAKMVHKGRTKKKLKKSEGKLLLPVRDGKLKSKIKKIFGV